MRKKAAAKELRDFMRTRRCIAAVDNGGFTRKRENFCRKELAEGKLAGVAFLHAMVAVVNFGFAKRVLVFAVFDRHFLFQVMQTVQRRVQHRKQESACQEKLPYGTFTFQTAANLKELHRSFGKIR